MCVFIIWSRTCPTTMGHSGCKPIITGKDADQPAHKSFPADINPAGRGALLSLTIDFHINFVHWDVVSYAPASGDRGSQLHIVNIYSLYNVKPQILNN